MAVMKQINIVAEEISADILNEIYKLVTNKQNLNLISLIDTEERIMPQPGFI